MAVLSNEPINFLVVQTKAYKKWNYLFESGRVYLHLDFAHKMCKY